jgi:hypothetical protein
LELLVVVVISEVVPLLVVTLVAIVIPISVVVLVGVVKLLPLRAIGDEVSDFATLEAAPG